MKEYNSYPEAKIANPQSNIYVSISGVFADSDHVSFIALSGVKEGWNKCNPAEYCMTVEQFEDSGKRLVDGDLYINLDGHVITYNEGYGLGVDRDPSRNGGRFILRAAALEEKEKPKRVKFEYQLLCNTSFNVWGLKALLDNGDLFYLINDEYVVVPSGSDIFAIEHFLSGNIYRRVEAEISERDEFVSVMNKLQEEYILDDNYDTEEFGEFLFDSGKLKLVD